MVNHARIPASCGTGADYCLNYKCCPDLCQYNKYQTGRCGFYITRTRKGCMCTNDYFVRFHSPAGQYKN
uniref:Uncharacterized protein n=1 Tax=Romanomermis culicivorax TaxID=13658 RepID=A0A915IXI0_ROMCU